MQDLVGEAGNDERMDQANGRGKELVREGWGVLSEACVGSMTVSEDMAEGEHATDVRRGDGVAEAGGVASGGASAWSGSGRGMHEGRAGGESGRGEQGETGRLMGGEGEGEIERVAGDAKDKIV